MSGGGDHVPPQQHFPSETGGEFLLRLLQNRPLQTSIITPAPNPSSARPPYPDIPSNGHDIYWTPSHSPYLGFPQNPNLNWPPFPSQDHNIGFPNFHAHHNLIFGSFRPREDFSNGELPKSGSVDCPVQNLNAYRYQPPSLFSNSQCEANSHLNLNRGFTDKLNVSNLNGKVYNVSEERKTNCSHELEHISQKLNDALGLGEDDLTNYRDDSEQHSKGRDKNFRLDARGQMQLSQRVRNFKRNMQCRSDINRLNGPFLKIYQSLVPAEDEKTKQIRLLILLGELVSKEWPKAKLHLYGSCANSFGVSNSDIDICLAIEDADIDKAEVVLKLADILQSGHLQNVQALPRARVPVVKFKDAETGISCDICINNVLAVVNTKLLHDYAQIDVRLRQLAFIVKHWAKSRGINATYQGTLSSYAYVLMCIHFLQQRRPAILPCLQGMKTTYSVTVDGVQCAYFDRVEKLRNFGFGNKETISQLVWAFFNYWAYCHDYANTAISVRTGLVISKHAKEWTRRIGNDRHLICIEDPFEVCHDLGRVVDRSSIKVLREEFERAAEIMQRDPDPCINLFQPYVPSYST